MPAWLDVFGHGKVCINDTIVSHLALGKLANLRVQIDLVVGVWLRSLAFHLNRSTVHGLTNLSLEHNLYSRFTDDENLRSSCSVWCSVDCCDGYVEGASFDSLASDFTSFCVEVESVWQGSVDDGKGWLRVAGGFNLCAVAHTHHAVWEVSFNDVCRLFNG